MSSWICSPVARRVCTSWPDSCVWEVMLTARYAVVCYRHNRVGGRWKRYGCVIVGCALRVWRLSRRSDRVCARIGRMADACQAFTQRCTIAANSFHSPRHPRTLSRFSAVSRCRTLVALCTSPAVQALELPLTARGEDVVGQVQVIQATYEDTFADLGTAHDLGYLEMV